MNRIKIIFAGLLGLLFFPAWRLLDNVAFLWPHPTLYSIGFFFCFFFFIALPLKLVCPQWKKLWIFAGTFLITALTWWAGPISHMASIKPDFNHCGYATYTGLFYPASSFLSAAYQDDLEARNQLCWVRKLVSRIPNGFQTQNEFEDYLKLLDQKLILPEHKYRVSLPLITFLHGMLATRWEITQNPVTKVQTGAIFLDKLRFWTSQYTDEISSRQYSWWDWPMGPYIQFEYGLIEKNWENILNSLQASP